MAVRLGPYILLSKLATGGMAELFLARRDGPEGFQKLAVVKRILPQYAADPEFVGMFLDEARLAARLDHPNIVHIYDLGKTKDSFFIAMEYVAGEDLRSIAMQARQHDYPLPEGHMVRIYGEVAAALHHAHTRTDADGRPLGIVHRDVSPQNILVSYEGATKLTDFGIAKAARQAGVTKDGVLKGKHAYLSPEQVTGQNVDHRSDVFALGICLYEFATRTRLFKRENELAMVRAIAEEPITPPRKIRPTIAAGLDEIILVALEKDPARRFATAQAMQLALERFGRDAEHQVGAVELSDYMKELFSDKIRAQNEAAQQAQKQSFEALLLEAPGGGEEGDGGGGAGLEHVLPGGRRADGGSSTSGMLFGQAEPSGRGRAPGPRRWWPLAAGAAALIAGVAGLAWMALLGTHASGEGALSARAHGPGGGAETEGEGAAGGGGGGDDVAGLDDGRDESAVKGKSDTPAAPAREAETEVGLLYITVPGYEGPALLYLDGKLVAGNVPSTISEVPAGPSHMVRLEIAGYVPAEREERVEARRTTNVDFPLEPAPAAPSPPPPPPSPSAPGPALPAPTSPRAHTGAPAPGPAPVPSLARPRGVAAAAAPAPAPAPAGTMAKLAPRASALDGAKGPLAPAAPGPAARVPVFFDAKPWAAVYLDGRKLCTTPCYYDLAPGKYAVTFRHDPAKLEKKVAIKVMPTGTNKVVVKLR
ncbi:MAG TPA: serine/threonine-protein kinase [Myxococcota bacterium]|nr:serine/threonine-protein kinase [Myxococcota bacterium]